MLEKNNIKYALVLLFLLVGLSSILSFAQDSERVVLRLDLKKTMPMAFDASEDFQIQANEIERKRFEYNEERSEILPQLNGTLTWSNNFEYPDIPATAATKDYGLNSGLTVDQTIFTFGKVSSAIKAAKQAIDVSEYDKETLKQKIIYETKLAYYSTYLAKRTLDIVEESYWNAVQNKEILKNRSISGRVSKHDNIKISADIASRKPTMNNARTGYYSAIETLKVILGLGINIDLELTEGFLNEFPDFNRDTMALALYNNQPAIKSLAKSISEKKDLIKSKKGEFYPEISVFASWNHKGDSDDHNVGNSNLEDYGLAGLKIDVPFWTGGKTAAELGQARIDERNAELEYQKGKEEYLLDLDKSLSEYRGYLKTLESNQEAVQLAEEAFKLSQELFKSGQISVTDLNDSELKLTNEKINKEITLFNISIIIARIERLTLKDV